MNKPQTSISMNFGSEWRIRRPYIYRYLNKNFVNDFFEHGILRLSSFKTFANHTDEQRLDKQEGQGMVVHRNSTGQGQTISAFLSQGQNAYVLCGSTLFNHGLAGSFQTDSGFRIDHILGFAHSVSKHIPGFAWGIEGQCRYLNQRILSRDMGKIDFESLKTVTMGVRNQKPAKPARFEMRVRKGGEPDLPRRLKQKAKDSFTVRLSR